LTKHGHDEAKDNQVADRYFLFDYPDQQQAAETDEKTLPRNRSDKTFHQPNTI